MSTERVDSLKREALGALDCGIRLLEESRTKAAAVHARMGAGEYDSESGFDIARLGSDLEEIGQALESAPDAISYAVREHESELHILLPADASRALFDSILGMYRLSDAFDALRGYAAAPPIFYPFEEYAGAFGDFNAHTFGILAAGISNATDAARLGAERAKSVIARVALDDADAPRASKPWACGFDL